MDARSVKITVRKTRGSRGSRIVEFLVDSGTVYSVVSGSELRALGCKSYRMRDFFLADGTKITRQIGDAYFEYKGVGGPAPVIFGERGDRNLLGVTTLEALELVLDPFRQELHPMTVNLMGAVPDYENRSRRSFEKRFWNGLGSD